MRVELVTRAAVEAVVRNGWEAPLEALGIAEADAPSAFYWIDLQGDGPLRFARALGACGRRAADGLPHGQREIPKALVELGVGTRLGVGSMFGLYGRGGLGAARLYSLADVAEWAARECEVIAEGEAEEGPHGMLLLPHELEGREGVANWFRIPLGDELAEILREHARLLPPMPAGL